MYQIPCVNFDLPYLDVDFVNQRRHYSSSQCADLFSPVTSLRMEPTGDQLSAESTTKRDTNLNRPLVFAIQSETHSKPLPLCT